MVELVKRSTGQFHEDERMTQLQNLTVQQILVETEFSNQDKAWELVDFFKMERRGNRQMFLQMLNKYQLIINQKEVA